MPEDSELMELEVTTPAEAVVSDRAQSLTAVTLDGSFGVLPKHIDLVAPLVPSILSYFDSEGTERLIAVDVGTLLKIGRSVQVAVRQAVRGDDLDSLEDTVRKEFLALTEQERDARLALARLEAGIVRRFIELERKPTI